MNMNDHFAKQLAVEAAGASMIPGEDTLLARYERQLADAELRVSNLKKLIRLLNENPATLEIMQLAGRL